jgi:hypothetical protein
MDYSNENEKKQFTAALTGLAAIFRHDIKREVYALYWDVFKDSELTDFLAACKAHMIKGKFFPVPAELLALMPNQCEHIGADEAWSLVLESMDEFSTVILNQQIAEARGIAWAIYEDGDKIAARMAFKEAYNRIIKTSPKPQWYISEGYDRARRADAVAKAVQMGRLPSGPEIKYLDAPATYAGLIEGAKKHSNIDPVEMLEKIKPMLIDETLEQVVERRQEKRKRFEDHRENELRKLFND